MYWTYSYNPIDEPASPHGVGGVLVTCTETTNAVSLYEGIGKIQFVKTSFDSLIGQFYRPITNNYTMVSITNSQTSVRNFQRVVTSPDFLMTAQDTLTAGGDGGRFGRSTPLFNSNNALPGRAGPLSCSPTPCFPNERQLRLKISGPDFLPPNV